MSSSTQSGPAALMSALAGLATSDDLPPSARRQAGVLHQRIAAPIRIGIFGPNADLTIAVHEELEQKLDPALLLQADLFAVSKEETLERLHKVDLAIWATAVFESEEREIWAAAPDLLKDHSLLAVLGTPEFAGHLELADQVADEFVACLPIRFDGNKISVDEIVDWLRQDATRGRAEELEAAEIFCAKYAHAVLPIHTNDGHVDGRSVLAPSAEAKVPSTSTSAPMQSPLEALRSCGESVLHLLEEDGEGAFESILAQCTRTMEDLSEQLAETPGANPAMIEDVGRACDTVTLMALENNISSTIDAITVLLQMRNELAMSHAA